MTSTFHRLCCRTYDTRYSYAGCLRVGDGPAERDVAKAVSLFERLGDEGLLEAKVHLRVDCKDDLRKSERGLDEKQKREAA